VAGAALGIAGLLGCSAMELARGDHLSHGQAIRPRIGSRHMMPVTRLEPVPFGEDIEAPDLGVWYKGFLCHNAPPFSLRQHGTFYLSVVRFCALRAQKRTT